MRLKKELETEIANHAADSQAYETVIATEQAYHVTREASGEGERYSSYSVGNSVAVAADGVSGTVALANDVQSAGSFTMELVLDGETIYTSEAIAPGEKLEAITLEQPLAPGQYEAIIEIKKYDDDGNYIFGQRQPVTITVEAE